MCNKLIESEPNGVDGVAVETDHLQETIGRMRGKFFQYNGIRVMCTYHPAYLTYTLLNTWLMGQDRFLVADNVLRMERANQFRPHEFRLWIADQGAPLAASNALGDDRTGRGRKLFSPALRRSGRCRPANHRLFDPNPG